METLFSQDYWLFWAFALGAALFWPVRRLVWVLYVRRAQRQAEVDEAEQQRLKRRATITAILICLVFSVAYVGQLFKGSP